MKLDYRLLGRSGAHGGAAGGGGGRSCLFCFANLPEKHTIKRRLLKYQTAQQTASQQSHLQKVQMEKLTERMRVYSL